MLDIITALILISGIINLVRLSVFMVAADVYDVRKHKADNKEKKNTRKKLPKFTILIPAFNEEVTIAKTLTSVLAADYKRKEIIVIDDGSTDDTAKIVRTFTKVSPRTRLRLVRQKNGGKGSALNNGISKATGDLIMVLDADSTIARDSLTNAVKYFDDPQVKAIASSVGLEDNGKWLGLIQKVEYLLAYRMKRSLTALNIEYIIGGVGSIYRKSTLKQVSGYRHNTITEDIDLSMKVVARGNKAYRVMFAADVRTRTEPVHSFKELISQRYRWKIGRLQAFVRYRHMFLSKNKKYSKLLTWFQLPYAILGEIYLVMEPLFIFTILFVTVAYGDISSLPTAMVIISSFMILNILATDDESFKTKLALIYLVPVIYFMLPVLAFVELVSLMKSLRNWRKISPNIKITGSWMHVKRVINTTT